MLPNLNAKIGIGLIKIDDEFNKEKGPENWNLECPGCIKKELTNEINNLLMVILCSTERSKNGNGNKILIFKI